jgi:hydrogenase maturation protein HypF
LSEAGDLAIRVRGQVQGVGFRPFVWQLAQAHGVTGQVLNDPEGVLIHARGATGAFLEDLRAKAPPLSRIDAVETTPHSFPEPPASFLIAASEGVGARTRVTPDAATCADCLREIRDPTDRRHGYAFANCTHCGPRLSILDRLPYDRRKPPWPSSRCARIAAPSTKTRATVASTRNLWLVPSADRPSGWKGAVSSFLATCFVLLPFF